MAKRSKIYIKPSKRGSLRKAMGAKKGQKLSVSAMRSKLKGASPAMRKKLQFALNARKWHHEDGGYLMNPLSLPEYADGGFLSKLMGGLSTTSNIAGKLMPIVGLASTVFGGVKSLLDARKANKEQEETISEQNKATELANAEAAQDTLAQSRIAGLGTPINYAPVVAKGGYLNYLGQSHKGPSGGIMVDENGNPTVVSKKNPVASVEGGELAVSLEGEPYVYSKQLGYADEANKIIKKFTRGGKINNLDKMASDAMYNQLSSLRDEQELINNKNTGMLAKGGKIEKVMHEFKQGTLHIGKSKKIVKNRKQAIAIALSEAGKSRKKETGGYLPILQDGGDFYRMYSPYDIGYNPVENKMVGVDLTNMGFVPHQPGSTIAPYGSLPGGGNAPIVGGAGGRSTKRIAGSTPALDRISSVPGEINYGQTRNYVPNNEMLPQLLASKLVGTEDIRGKYTPESAPESLGGKENITPTLSPLGHGLSLIGNLMEKRYLKKHKPALLKAPKFGHAAYEKISFAPERAGIESDRRAALAGLVTQGRNAGLTGAQYLSGVGTGMTGINTGASKLISESLGRETATNTSGLNATNQLNAQINAQKAQAQAQTEIYNALLQNQYQQQLLGYEGMLPKTIADYAKQNAAYGMNWNVMQTIAPNMQLGKAPKFLPWLLGKTRPITFSGPPIGTTA